MTDPSAVLTTPVAHEPIPESLDAYLHIADLISLGHWALKAIDMMGGPNLPDEMGGRRVLGHGEKKRKKEKKKERKKERVFFFLKYRPSLDGIDDDQQVNFEDIAGQFDSTAFGVYEMSKAVGDMVESLADYAIAAGVSLAAAAATSERRSWAASLVGALQDIRSTRALRSSRKSWSSAPRSGTCARRCSASSPGSLGSIQGFTAERLPAGYDNRVVG